MQDERYNDFNIFFKDDFYLIIERYMRESVKISHLQ